MMIDMRPEHIALKLLSVWKFLVFDRRLLSNHVVQTEVKAISRESKKHMLVYAVAMIWAYNRSDWNISHFSKHAFDRRRMKLEIFISVSFLVSYVYWSPFALLFHSSISRSCGKAYSRILKWRHDFNELKHALIAIGMQHETTIFLVVMQKKCQDFICRLRLRSSVERSSLVFSLHIDIALTMRLRSFDFAWISHLKLVL